MLALCSLKRFMAVHSLFGDIVGDDKMQRQAQELWNDGVLEAS